MLSDFIEANGINARVLKYPSDASVENVLKDAHLSKSAAAIAVPFVDDKMDFFVVIASREKIIPISDAESYFGVPLSLPLADDVLNMTGFEAKHFPPVAVFGAKVAFDSSVSKQATLLFELSPREYLVIPKKEIEKAQELIEDLI